MCDHTAFGQGVQLHSIAVYLVIMSDIIQICMYVRYALMLHDVISQQLCQY